MPIPFEVGANPMPISTRVGDGLMFRRVASRLPFSVERHGSSMRLNLIFLVPFVAVFAALPAGLFASTTDTRSSAGIEPISLRVESLKNPVGLDTAVPRFSWKLKAVDTKAHNL